MSTFILILFKKQKFHREKQEEYIHSVPFFLKKIYPMQNKKILSQSIHYCPATIQTRIDPVFYLSREKNSIEIYRAKIRQNSSPSSKISKTRLLFTWDYTLVRSNKTRETRTGAG